MELITQLTALFEKLKSEPVFAVTFLVTVVAFTLIYFYLMKFLIKNNSGSLIAVFVLVEIVFGAILVLNVNVANDIFLIIPVLLLIIVMILYAVEIKRIIWQRNETRHLDVKRVEDVYDEEKIEQCITEIIKALQDMSKNDVGAIIVLSNGNVPAQILDSGVKMDSNISSELIESVFFPKTPLHDGAMILNGTRIVASGCFLPLSQQVDNIPKDLGTRHRAGLGITENIDVVSLIVSEETGIITVAKAGKMTRYADTKILTKTLNEYYWKELSGGRK